MSYPTKQQAQLYEKWFKKFEEAPSDCLVSEVAVALRSKLTALMMSAEVIADDLKANNLIVSDDHEFLIDMIIETSRNMNVLLDAAVQAERDNATEHNMEDAS